MLPHPTDYRNCEKKASSVTKWKRQIWEILWLRSNFMFRNRLGAQHSFLFLFSGKIPEKDQMVELAFTRSSWKQVGSMADGMMSRAVTSELNMDRLPRQKLMQKLVFQYFLLGSWSLSVPKAHLLSVFQNNSSPQTSILQVCL